MSDVNKEDDVDSSSSEYKPTGNPEQQPEIDTHRNNSANEHNNNSNSQQHYNMNDRVPSHAWINGPNELNNSYDDNFYRVTAAPEPKPKINSNFYPGHRRVRSGDEVVWNHNFEYSNYNRHPGPYSMSPIPHNPRQSMSHSASAVNLRNQQVYSPFEHQPPPNRFPHSISLDLSSSVNTGQYHYRQSNQYVHEYLCKQSTSFVTLQQAIARGEQTLLKLEKEVQEKEKELNLCSAVSRNPTEKEYNHLKEENEYLQKEIQEMFTEMDRIGLQFPGDISANLYITATAPVVSTRRPPPALPPDITGEDDNTLATKPVFIKPRVDYNRIAAPITSQPPPTYDQVVDPAPRYDETVRRVLPPPLPPPPIIQRPVPVPPAICAPPIDSEEWKCPKCTFNNLLVAECELCYTPRPVLLNRR